MKTKLMRFFSVFMVLVMLLGTTSMALASDVEVTSVVDVTAPTGSVTLTPGESSAITINLTVTGNQDGTAHFSVYQDWTLSGGTFTGSNSKTFEVLPQGGGTTTTFTTTGKVTVATGQVNGPFTLTVSAFGITNSNQQGGKLVDGKDATYQVIVSAPEKTPSTVTVSCPTSVTYNGTAQTPCSATVTGSGGLNETLEVAYSNNVNVGTATASASYLGDQTHTSSSDSKTFTIEKASVTATAGSGSGIYNGVKQSPSDCVVSGTYTDGLSCTNNPTEVGPESGTYTIAPNVSGANLANFAVSSNNGSYSIGKAASTVTVTCDAGPFTYTGSEFTPCKASVTGAGGLNQSLTVSYTDNINAGTVTASASYAGDANHDGNNGSATFSIDKATSSVAVTCEAGPFIYTGSEFKPCSAKVTGAGGLDASLTVSYTDNINAGSAKASASYAGDSNHNGSDGSANFTIDKAPSTVTVTCTSNVTYTGSALTPCTAVATGAGGLNELLTVAYADNINAGTASASAIFAGDGNHTGNIGSDTFTIDKAPSTVTVTCTEHVTYTGLALEPCTAAVKDAGDLDQALTVIYADNINAGTAKASATFAGDDNHFGSENSTSFTIDKAPSTVVVSCPEHVTYNGSAQEPCAAVVVGAGGLNEPLTVTYVDNTNAGTATASASYAGDANHTGDSDSQTFTIDKAPSIVTVTCPASIVFTGSPITPCSATVTGAGGLNQSLPVSYSNNTAVGTATASATYAGDTNHTGSSDSETFDILAWDLKGFYQPVDMNGIFNTVKNGSTVPLKFEIFAGLTELTDVSNVKSLATVQVTCNTNAVTDEIETTATGGTALRYDLTGGQFIFNWKTPSTAGKCYRVTMTTLDGSPLQAYFKLK